MGKWTNWWIWNSLLVHILFLGSVWQIYFHSNLIHNLQPQGTLKDSDLGTPADRLVIFFIDGLGANTFFQNKCSSVPDIRDLFCSQGIVGVVHRHAPSNTRPGSIATFGGFNEDPSAALTNYNSYSAEFDTIFNRSDSVYGWGSLDVLELFANMSNAGENFHFNNYTDKKITMDCKADAWVHQKVKDFLSQDSNVNDILNQETPIFFIYFADLDRSGHMHKPNSKEYLKQLYSTQQRIREIYDLFEQKFKDNRTVYLMTSDPGMTSSGSHGGHSLSEIDVPFFIWGSGVTREAPNSGMTFTADDSDLQLPFHELEQIQLASLMSAWIGLPPPMNNMGILPLGYMKVTPKYEAEAAHLNALQLLEQVASILEIYEKSPLQNLLPQFKKLNLKRIGHYKDQFSRLVSLVCYEQALNISKEVSELAVECLEFYKDYYRNALLVTITLSYIGWLYYLLLILTRNENEPTRGFQYSAVTLLLIVIGIALVLPILQLQSVPGWTAFYLLLPMAIWIMALRERKAPLMAPLVHISWMVIDTCLIVAAFKDRRLLWLAYTMIMCIHNRQGFVKPSIKFILWIYLLLLLGICSVLPAAFGRQDKHLLCFSILGTLLRPLALKEHHGMRVWIINGSILIMAAYCTYQRENDILLMAFRPFAVVYTAYAFLSIPFSNQGRRLNLIWFNLSTVYALLCTSYESFFIQLLIMEYLMSRKIHIKETADSHLDHLNSSYRQATFVLLYFYFSFFGIAQLSSISSIDRNTAHLFMTGDSINFIRFLVILKISIPSIIIISSMYSKSSYIRSNIKNICICLFLISDSASLYFFHRVRNQGSWQEVRYSISHFLIVHSSVFVIMIYAGIAKLLHISIPQF